jgi:peroxiredoxin
MSLTQRLKALFRHRSTPARQAAHADYVARAAGAEVVKRALGVGDKAPAFLLPNAEGELVASDDLLEAGPLVIAFFRGGWCPYCELTMQALDEVLPDIAAAGGSLVAIWPDTGGLALRTKRERRLRLEVLVDVDNAVAMQFGIVLRTPDLYRDLLLESGVDLAQRHGNPGWLLPLPATYVVGPDGVIRYMFAEGDFTARAEPADIIRAVRTVTGSPQAKQA